MPERALLILDARLKQVPPTTQRTLATELGISITRVGQIEKTAILHLRHWQHCLRRGEYLPLLLCHQVNRFASYLDAYFDAIDASEASAPGGSL